MPITRYLAMTADEFSSAQPIPEKIAWMACHFSPYSTSLSNLPQNLPPKSLLILNDSTPPEHQDCQNVVKIIDNILKEQNCCGLLLDFQREECPQNKELAQALTQLNFPVCVTESYARDLNCPVLLPPLPLTIPLQEYLAPWQNREIWLEIALNCEEITVTSDGSISKPESGSQECHMESRELHCHYQVRKTEDSIIFTLRRTRNDLDELLEEAEALGVTAAIGLYQELK